MEITVNCPCGQNYAFEVEPVNGAMPCAVNCPGCNADGTQLANQMIAGAQAAPAAAVSMPAMAPQAVAAAAPSGGLRINRPAPAPVAATAEPVASPQKVYTRAMTESSADAPPESDENIPMGILGGIVGGTIAMLGWYFIIVASGREFGILAWFVGVIAGFGVRVLGRDGTALLGVIAAICACLAIVGGEFMATNRLIDKALSRTADLAYTQQLESSREGLKAKSDEEIKKWISKHDETEGEIPQKEIERFREERQAKMQAMVDGKPSRAEYKKTFTSKINTWNFKYTIFRADFSLFTVLFLCFGIASAYRIASG